MRFIKLYIVLFSIVLMILSLSCPSFAGNENQVRISDRSGPRIAFNFVDVEIPTIVKFISEITGNNFLFDERIKGKITIIAPTKLSIDESFTLFTSVLSLKGFTIIPSGPRTYKIIPSSLAKQEGIMSQDESIPINEGYITKLVPLENIKVDEAVQFLRALWSADGSQFTGRFYSTAGIDLEPKPLQRPSPPIWIGSWGSDAGLRRVARLGDGWLASAYNTTPDQFRVGLEKLRVQLKNIGKDPANFPNALVTMFMYITAEQAEADRILSETIGALLKRPVDQLRERLLVGAPQACAEKLAAYRAAGVQRVFLWPVSDELDQLAIFREKVTPLVGA